MQTLLIKYNKLKAVFFCSVFAVVMHVFSLYYPFLAEGRPDEADLSALAGICIAIDPGHGGIDNGATRNNVKEKKINLEIAFELMQVLCDAGANVVLTRDSDIDYYTRGKGGKRNDLMKRIEIIEKANPRLFVSIHANAIAGSQWSGAQVFYNPQVPENQALAETVQEALRHFPPGNRRQAKQDLNILVLNRTSIPGILIETGYVSNPAEAARLSDPQYQQKMAVQIAKALAYHLRNNATR